DWGFTYKTVSFYWAKLNKSADPTIYRQSSFFAGLGFWTRANPELCLLATRGQPHRRRANVRKLIVSPRREHSRKPEEAYVRIEALCAASARDAGAQTAFRMPPPPLSSPSPSSHLHPLADAHGLPHQGGGEDFGRTGINLPPRWGRSARN